MSSRSNPALSALDLFSGAGGMSVGATAAGICVTKAVENDRNAANTFRINHPSTKIHVRDIRNITRAHLPTETKNTILFGGPPCQGFSTSNQRTRSKSNKQNWMFQEFMRIARLWRPDWIVFENVRGILETEKGFFVNEILFSIEKLGYTANYKVLNSENFGVPQNRSRLFLVASKSGISFRFPKPKRKKSISVKQAIADLPSLDNGESSEVLPYLSKPISNYARRLRKHSRVARNNLIGTEKNGHGIL